MGIIKRLFGIKEAKSQPVVPVHVAQTKMRLSQWRANQGMTNLAGKITRNPDFELMLSVLHNEHPAFVVCDAGTSLQDRAVYQARCEGYTLALANLEALAIHQPEVNMPEAEFAPEEHPE